METIEVFLKSLVLAWAARGRKATRVEPGFGPDSLDAEVWCGSYAGDFETLWNLDAALRSNSAGKERSRRHFVIVLDAAPTPKSAFEREVAQNLTVFDWVAAISVRALELQPSFQSSKAKRGICSGIRISIIDIAPTLTRGTALVQAQMALAAMPWVQVFRGAAQMPLHGAIDAPAGWLCEIGDCIAEDSEDAVLWLEPRNADGHLIALRAWLQSKLVESGGVHGLSNLVAPVLMLGEQGRLEFEEQLRRGWLEALMQWLRASGLLVGSIDSLEAPAAATCGDGLGRPERRYILVDDMWRRGWREVVGAAVGRGAEVTCCDGPEDRKLGSAGQESLFSLLDRPCPPGEREELRGAVLLLDLRLFTGLGKRQELEFLGRLCDLIDRHKGRDPNSPLNILAAQVESVVRYAKEGDQKSDDYAQAITLLPSVVALLEPWLPVIVFSSTGQRRTIALLERFANVVTAFQKPRLPFSGADAVPQAWQGLQLALRRADRIHHARRVQGCLFDSATSPAANSRLPHVQVFFDESGKVDEPGFHLAGIVFISRGVEFVRQLNAKLLERHVQWGSCAGDDRPTGRLIPKEGYSFPRHVKEVFEPVQEIAQELGLRPLGFSTTRPEEVLWNASLSGADLGNPWCLDNLYRDMMLKTLEVLLWEVIPAALGSDTYTCDVHLAVRDRYRGEFDDDELWNGLCDNFGVEVKPGNDNGRPTQKFRSLMPDDAHPMVADVLRRGPVGRVLIRQARGARLIYGRKPCDLMAIPQAVHLLADTIAKYSTNDDALQTEPLRSWFAGGFSSRIDPDFEGALEACRLARLGRGAEGFLHLTRCAMLPGWARWRMRPVCDALSQADRRYVFDRMAVDVEFASTH